MVFYCILNLQEGWSALHLAATEGNLEIVKLLLNEGCNVNLQTGVSEKAT